MELTQLKYFCDVAHTQHMTQSARRLHVAQPALSQSMHRLEDELGVVLFEHKGRNIRLTTEGARLYGQLRPILDALDSAVDEVKLSAAQTAPTIRVGIFSASHIVVDAIAEYMAKNVDVSFEVMQKEDEGRFDIAVRTIHRASGRRGASRKMEAHSARTNALAQSKVRTVEFCEAIGVVVPSDFGIEDSVNLADLEQERFICLAGSRSFRHLCDELCAQRGFFPNVAFESDRLDIVKKMIGLGFGVGFWPEFSWGEISSDTLHWVRIAEKEFVRILAIELAPRSGDAAKMFYDFLIGRVGRIFSSE